MTVAVTAEPEAVGVSSKHLEYLDAHVQRYIDDGKLPGGLVLVARKGEVIHLSALGMADCERGVPTATDTIYRIYSMSKPLTSIALMQLFERGLVQLDDPVHRYIPAWKNLRVLVSGEHPDFVTEPLARHMTVRDLLSHQSGLSYGFPTGMPIDEAYRRAGIGARDTTLAEMAAKLADLPLAFQPGTRWNYSFSTDMCGHLVELISGQRFDEYLDEHIIGPLGMVDTSFSVTAEKVSRFAACYGPSRTRGIRLVDDPTTSTYLQHPAFLSGGGGLTSTATDYWRFTQALANGGELDGVRIIGPKTLKLMASNHLANGADLAASALTSQWTETGYGGTGFGLGFSVTLDIAQAQVSGTPGEFAWGGAASTAFWVDQAEELVFVFMTQLMPSTTYNIRREFRAIVYGALTAQS
ncbi:MAG TPA: serine hydrolase domain-containing protein [Tepidiformaceae bacterium]